MLPSGIPFNILNSNLSENVIGVTKHWYHTLENRYIHDFVFNDIVGGEDNYSGKTSEYEYYQDNMYIHGEADFLSDSKKRFYECGMFGTNAVKKINIVYYKDNSFLGTNDSPSFGRSIWTPHHAWYFMGDPNAMFTYTDEQLTISSFLVNIPHAHIKQYETIHDTVYDDIFSTDRYNTYKYINDSNATFNIPINRYSIYAISGILRKGNDRFDVYKGGKYKRGRVLIFKIGEPWTWDPTNIPPNSTDANPERIRYNPFFKINSDVTVTSFTMVTGNNNQLPNCRWYKVSSKSLPWGTGTNFKYMTNFLAASGFNFTYGGWSSLLSETSENT
jgi:hypothetical protein